MAKFSVNYTGIANVESRLHDLYRRTDQIAGDLSIAAKKVSKAKSLENKGYYTAVLGNGVEVGEDADVIRVQGLYLDDIGHEYSRTEKRVLELLSDRVSSGGFSSESAAIVQDALKTHRAYQRDNSVKRILEDTFDTQTIRGGFQRFRFWASTTGKEWVDKVCKVIPGGIDDAIINGAIEGAKKKWEEFEDIYSAVCNPTNPDALATGGRALAGMLGLGGFADMVPRYSDMTDAISNRVVETWQRGDKGKAVCYALSSTTLMTFQFMGDAVYNAGDFFLNMVTLGGYKRVKKAAKLTHVTEAVDNFFTGIGDWCWSRLDSAYGV